MYCSGFVSFHRDEKEDGGDDTTIYDAIQKKNMMLNFSRPKITRYILNKIHNL